MFSKRPGNLDFRYNLPVFKSWWLIQISLKLHVEQGKLIRGPDPLTSCQFTISGLFTLNNHNPIVHSFKIAIALFCCPSQGQGQENSCISSPESYKEKKTLSFAPKIDDTGMGAALFFVPPRYLMRKARTQLWGLCWEETKRVKQGKLTTQRCLSFFLLPYSIG